MINKLIVGLALGVFSTVSFASPSAECFRRPLTLQELENQLALRVGLAVVYPMDEETFDQSVSCLFSQFVLTEVSIAGFGTEITGGLLRIMAADPEQFFKLALRQDPQAIELWIRYFGSVSLWPREKCPNFDPIIVARASIENIRLAHPQSETLRKRVLLALKDNRCRVAS